MSEKHLLDGTTQLQGLDEFVERIMQDWKAPGVALTVIKGDEVIFAQGFGKRDVAQGLPVTPQTLFPMASCTKAFTTAAMSVLVDQGMLDWDTPVREYLPRFRLFDSVASERVTPRDLVAHRTGLPRHDLVWYNNTTISRQELVARLRYLEPTKDLRTLWQYQNMMYVVAGQLIEEISGQTWEEFVRTHLFQPLDMPTSNFDIVQTSKEYADFSHPYLETENEVEERDFYNAQAAVAPCGAIVSNIAEMGNWVRLHLNGGKYKGQQLISSSQIELLHTPQMVMPQISAYPEMPYASYALGWSVTTYRGRPKVAHSGGIDGFRTLTTLFPEEQIGIVALSNMSYVNVPEILTYNVFERLVGLDETPWHERFMKDHLALKEGEQKGKEVSAAKRVLDAHPSHPLESYTGEFAHPGYGTLSVSRNGDALEASFNDLIFSITHYHYDIFEMTNKRIGGPMKISFVTNVKGDIDTLIAPLEPTGNDIVFKRAAGREMQEKTFLEQFVGIYALLEMQFIVRLKGEQTLSISIPGQPDYELEPYQGLEFVPKGLSGTSIEFQRNASGIVTGALATLPYGVFNIEKKA